MSTFLNGTEPVLPLHELIVLLAITAERGIAQESVLRDSGITSTMLANEQARISYAQLGSVIDNAIHLTGDAALGLECGRRMHIGHLGILGTAVLTQPDLRSALQVMVKYTGIFIPAWELLLEQQDGHAVITATATIQIKRMAFAVEVLFGTFRTIMSFLLGSPVQFVKHEAVMSRPPYAARYAELTDAPIAFDAPRNASWFDAALLDRKLAYADKLTAQLAERYCASQLSSRHLRGPLEQARALLHASGRRAPSLAELARALRVSPRQLRRELHAEGASYRQLLDQVRKQRALELVSGSHLTVDEIANQLGFQDSRHFRRRFKQWTGDTPIAFRHASSERR